MKLFLDTADVSFIKKWKDTGLIDGVTTNPTSLAKKGGNPLHHIKDICKLLPHAEISVEVTEKEPNAIYKQAQAISKLSKNIFVKVPCHPDYYAVIKQLVTDQIKLNITLVFTLVQAWYMCKLGVQVISPFVGRLDDLDVDGIEGIYEIRALIDNYGYETEILAASLRSVRHLHQVLLAGADIATISPEIFEKSMSHPLTDSGMQKFLADWHKLGVRKFP